MRERIVWVTMIFIMISCGTQAREVRQWKNRNNTVVSEILNPHADVWHANILTTVFWIGEPAGGEAGSVCNRDSAWDMRWLERFGGTDHPRRRNGFHPAAFTPKQNPFYVALPYNDLVGRAVDHPLVRPFFQLWRGIPRAHRSLCKNRWIQVRYNGRICFAQWEDVGPAYSDDFEYVFGSRAPKSHARGLAGLDVSPAIRDYLKFPGSGKSDWKFVKEDDVVDGPWKNIITVD